MFEGRTGRKIQKAPTQGDTIGKFVHDQNVAHFRKCLKETTDEARRQVLLQLLADELTRK
jgi:hypothetical protein